MNMECPNWLQELDRQVLEVRPKVIRSAKVLPSRAVDAEGIKVATGDALVEIGSYR